MTIREIKAEARQRLREANKRPYVLTLLFVLCAEGVSGILTLLDYLASTLTVGGIGGIGVNAILGTVMTVLSLGVMLLQTVWGCHYSNFSVKLSRGRAVSFLDFMAPFRIFGSTLLSVLLVYMKIFLRAMLGAIVIALITGAILSAISDVAAITVIAVVMGLGLIISCYMVLYRYYFVYQALYDGDGCPAGVALQRSEILTKKNRLFLFKLDLSFLWYSVLVLMPSLLLLFQDESIAVGFGLQIPEQWMIPYSVAAFLISFVMQILFLPYLETTKAIAYNRLLSKVTAQQAPVTPQEMPILLDSASEPKQPEESELPPDLS